MWRVCELMDARCVYDFGSVYGKYCPEDLARDGQIAAGDVGVEYGAWHEYVCGWKGGPRLGLGFQVLEHVEIVGGEIGVDGQFGVDGVGELVEQDMHGAAHFQWFRVRDDFGGGC